MTIKQIDQFCMKWKISAQNIAKMMPMNMGTFNNKLKQRSGYVFSMEQHARLEHILKWMLNDLRDLHVSNNIAEIHKYKNLKPLLSLEPKTEK